MSEVVFARIKLDEEEGLVDRGEVEARAAAVERVDHSPGRGVFGVAPGAFLDALDGAVARKLSTGRLTIELEKSLVKDIAGVMPEGARDVPVRHGRSVALVAVREDGEICARSVEAELLSVERDDLALVVVREHDLFLVLDNVGLVFERQHAVHLVV